METTTDKIKKFFVWLFTLVGLVLVIIGGVQAVNIGLKQWIFTKADYNYCPEPYVVTERPDGGKAVNQNPDYRKQCLEQQESQKQRDAAQSVAFLVTGFPIFWGFYRRTKRD